MKGRHLIFALAILFFIISPTLSFYFVPSLKKIPSNLNETIFYEGELRILNPKTATLDYKKVDIVRKIRSMGYEENVLLIREDIEVFDKLRNERIDELCMVKIYGIDPYTAKNIEGFGDIDRAGQWIFPVGVEKKNYLVWNSDLDDAFKKGYITKEEAQAWGRYIGEEKRGGVKTYKFSGGQENVFFGYLSQLPEVKIFYSGDLTAWVEPNTGTIVDLQKHIWQYAQFPNLRKLPSNLNISVFLDGKIVILNTSNALYEEKNITVCNHIENLKNFENYYIIKNEVVVTDEKGKKLDELCSYSEDAVNPYTMELIEFLCGKKGLLTFPIGVEKKDYKIWDSDIDDVSTVKFIEEEKISELKVYRYENNVENYFIGNKSIEGLSDRYIKLYYNGKTTYFVEPSTGFIVYLEKNGRIDASFPNLHTIPENFEASIKMEGKLSILSVAKEIEMTRSLKAKNVYLEDDKKVIVIEDITETKDKKSGEKIDMACKKEYHGVYADSFEEAKNYGDIEREGLFTFPPGVEKRDYLMWNTEINMPSIVSFIREEDHEGIHTYLFKTQEDRFLHDSTIGMDVRYITETDYWVEPKTGLIIDMKKNSVKKINPLEIITGIKGFFWIDIYKLNLSFKKETIEEIKEKSVTMARLLNFSNSNGSVLVINLKTKDIFENMEKAKEQKNQIEKLSENKVKVLDFRYWMKEKSVNEMAEKAKKASFLIVFLQIVIPSLLVLFGIALMICWIRKK
ncbi:MAG: porin PorA family protein [Candidatus Thermoplasmatota archaeon]